jgi:putative ABC transport system permease protein
LLLTEGAILAGGGALVAYLVAMWSAGAVHQLLPPDLPIGFDLLPDRRVFLFTFGIAGVAVMVFALAPALQASRLDVTQAIRSDDGRSSGRTRLQSAFLIIQVALCTALLAAGSLFLRSLIEARRIDPGFPAETLVDARMTPRGARYTRETGLVFWERTVAAARALPGVENATMAAIVPLTFENMETRFSFDGAPPLPDNVPRPRTYLNVVDENYFDTLGIRIVRGRAFTRQDRETSPHVAIVNETLAERTWPGQDPIGRRVQVAGGEGGADEWRVVVGVAADIRYNTLGEDPPIFTYLPVAQNYQDSMTVQVRAQDAGAVPSVQRALMDTIRGLDRTLSPPTIRPAAEEMQIVLLPAKVGAGLLGVFGMLALALAGVGIFGVASNNVAQHTREIGIRTAIGARPEAIVRWVLGRTTRNVIWGAVTGLTLAVGLGQLMTSFLYGISAADPVTFAIVPVILALAAALAAAVPARRAARVDPVVALRTE